MPRGPTTFRQRDLMRAIRAARAVGLAHFEVRIDKTGVISVVVDGSDRTTVETTTENPWERAIAELKGGQ